MPNSDRGLLCASIMRGHNLAPCPPGLPRALRHLPLFKQLPATSLGARRFGSIQIREVRASWAYHFEMGRAGVCVECVESLSALRARVHEFSGNKTRNYARSRDGEGLEQPGLSNVHAEAAFALQPRDRCLLRSASFSAFNPILGPLAKGGR
jgi:hypothetical protein